MYISDLIDEFKIDLEISNFSKETIRVYINSLKIFSKYMEEVLSITEIEKLKPSHLKAFQKFNKERGLRQKSLNMYISSLRKFFNFLIEEEIIQTKKPANSLKLSKSNKKITHKVSDLIYFEGSFIQTYLSNLPSFTNSP